MVRRIVTGHRASRAVFVHDGVPPRTHVFENIPGQAVSLVWATGPDQRMGFDSDGADRTADLTFLPALGETRLVMLTIPPQSVRTREDFDAVAAAREFTQILPEMAALREPADPAMHRTETIDYVIVLEGELVLELDDGQELLLKQNDFIVQNGTRHAWRNRGDRPVMLAVVLVGACRT